MVATTRRTDPLSKERIVAAAIEILDAEGARALTFRRLSAQLATGSGAIYWHVASKDELLADAAEGVIGGVMADSAGGSDPVEVIRGLALGLFDAIDAHPWVGVHVSFGPMQSGMPLILETVGEQLQALGVPEAEQFTCTSALVNYVLGVARQNASNSLLHREDRSTFLAAAAERWTQLDAGDYPFLHRVAEELRDQDDRAQFLAGVDLIVAGINTVR